MSQPKQSKQVIKSTTQEKANAPVIKESLSNNEKIHNPYEFQSNAKYFTICIYGLAFVALATLIIILFVNWNNTSAFVRGVMKSLTPFVIAFFIAYILNPFVKIISRALDKYIFKGSMQKARKILSITIVYLIVLALITITIVYITPEIITSVKDIEGVYQKLNITDIEQNITQVLEHLQVKYPQLDLQFIEDKVNELIPLLFSYGTNIATNLVSLSFSIVKTLINIILAIVISCYMLSDKYDLAQNSKRLVYAILPVKRAKGFIQTTKECNTIFSKFIIGKAIDSLIIGIICFVAMSILKLPYAILFSVFVGITNMIPYFGPFIGGIPGALVYLLIDPFKSLIFVIMIFALQQFDGLYLGPKILGESTGLTPLWVIFGITVGGAYFGVLGMFLGVPITAVIAFLLNKFIISTLKKKKINVD